VSSNTEGGLSSRIAPRPAAIRSPVVKAARQILRRDRKTSTVEFNAMDAASPELFGALKQRLRWLGQRQEVLARNIANSDTPRYRPHDLKPLSFSPLAVEPRRPVAMTATDAGHLQGRRRDEAAFASRRDRAPYETAPAGNAVVLEEQMAKVNETTISHQLATGLYRKHLAMIKTATGPR
jgi:flagellar basal-body rod protein FlgB